MIKEYGFGHQAASTCQQGSLQRVLLNTIEGKSSSSSAAAATDSGTTSLAPAGSASTAADAAAGQAAAAAARTKGFLNRLFNTLNWTLTEFTVCVGDLHNLRGRRSILEAQNQYRRTGLMFELSVNFMRILEFIMVSGGQLQRNVQHWLHDMRCAVGLRMVWPCCGAVTACEHSQSASLLGYLLRAFVA